MPDVHFQSLAYMIVLGRSKNQKEWIRGQFFCPNMRSNYKYAKANKETFESYSDAEV